MDPNRPPTPHEVRLARERLGLSGGAFAKLLGRKRFATVSDWETGKVTPNITAVRLEEIVTRALGGARPDGAVLPAAVYAASVLSLLEADAEGIRDTANRSLQKIAEARRVLGATGAGDLRYAATEARAGMKVAESPPARAAAGSRRPSRPR